MESGQAKVCGENEEAHVMKSGMNKENPDQTMPNANKNKSVRRKLLRLKVLES